MTARRDLLADLARLFGVTQRSVPSPPSIDDQSVWMFVAGLTSVADWIGSNQTFFKPFGNEERLNQTFNAEDYFGRAEALALQALEQLGWLQRARSIQPVTFRELFPKIENPRRLQEVMEEIVQESESPAC